MGAKGRSRSSTAARPRGAARAGGRLRGALPQPVRGGRPRARRCGDRPGRHPAGGGRRHRASCPPSASPSSPQARQHSRCKYPPQDVAESITITDNRTGESIEVPILDGGWTPPSGASSSRTIWFYDPALDDDRGHVERHHRARRRERHPPLPRLPDRAARRAVDLPRGGLPAHQRRAADAGAVRGLASRHHVPHVHPRERAQALPGGLPLRRPPDGDARLGDRRALHLLPRGRGHPGRRQPLQADHPPHRQDARRWRPPATGSAWDAVRVPGQLPRLLRELPVDDVEGRRASLRGQPRPGPGPRRAVHPPRRPRAELRTTAMRHVGIAHADPYIGHRRGGGRASTARATAAPTRP